jgi:hypothetical protein
MRQRVRIATVLLKTKLRTTAPQGAILDGQKSYAIINIEVKFLHKQHESPWNCHSKGFLFVTFYGNAPGLVAQENNNGI